LVSYQIDAQPFIAMIGVQASYPSRRVQLY
jgi:hypothetical protein